MLSAQWRGLSAVIVLLGPNGQLGWELRRALAPLGEVVALGRTRQSDGNCADLADSIALTDTLRALRPEVVVNAAAYTAVDKAESEPGLAHAVNADAPGLIARQMAEWGGWLLHFSTDYVFDGSGTHARTEDEAPAPLCTYGRSKLAGEQAIRASGCQHLILRTSWLHAARGGNFARTMLQLATERDALRVVDDQIGSPTGADWLADVAAHALRMAMSNGLLGGTYHACAGGYTSWCDYARHVVAWGRAVGLPLRTTPESVAGIPTSEFPSAAQRPLNSRLDTLKLRRSFGLASPQWQDGVDRMLIEALPSFLNGTR